MAKDAAKIEQGQLALLTDRGQEGLQDHRAGGEAAELVMVLNHKGLMRPGRDLRLDHEDLALELLTRLGQIGLSHPIDHQAGRDGRALGGQLGQIGLTGIPAQDFRIMVEPHTQLLPEGKAREPVARAQMIAPSQERQDPVIG